MLRETRWAAFREIVNITVEWKSGLPKRLCLVNKKREAKSRQRTKLSWPEIMM